MTLKQRLAAAAALIIAGASASTVLLDVRDPRPLETYYVAVRDDALVGIPQAFTSATAGDRILGERQGRDLLIGRERYTADVSPSVNVGGNDWRLAKLRTSPYLARSWQLYASEMVGVKFWGSMGDVVDACLGMLTAGECRTILRAVNDCWVQDDGSLCRHGYSTAPDTDGNPVACTVTAGSTWHPCEVLAGEDPSSIATEETPDLSAE